MTTRAGNAQGESRPVHNSIMHDAVGVIHASLDHKCRTERRTCKGGMRGWRDDGEELVARAGKNVTLGNCLRFAPVSFSLSLYQYF